MPWPTAGLNAAVDGSMGAMYDVVAERAESDDALCAVCGGGHSEKPNCIVFCDRCDLAVHQACYDLDTVPPGAYPTVGTLL